MSIICSLQGFSQSYNEARVKDSIVLDSLHRRLVNLKDSARVDCLNKISERSDYFYGSYNSDEFKKSGDSIYKYASMAYNEASRLNYKYGKATALLNLVHSYAVRSNFRDSSFLQAIKDSIFYKYRRQALALAKEAENDELLGRAYYETPDGDQIENYKKSIGYYRKAGNEKMELEVTTALVWEYTGGIEDATAVEYADNCIQLAKKITPSTPWEHELVQWAYDNLADLYKTAGDYETALAYVRQSAKYGKATNGMKEDINFCELYYLIGRYDSALLYWQNWKKDYDTYYFGHKAFGNTLLAKIYIKTGEYDKAIELLNLSVAILEKDHKLDEPYTYGLIRPYLSLGEAYEGKKDYKMALFFASKGLQLAKKSNGKPNLMQGYEIISRIYHQLGRDDSAYTSILEYNKLRDSVQDKQFIWRLNNYKRAADDAKKESQIGFLNRDNQIKHQQLKEESTFRNFIIAAFIALLFAGLYIFRNVNVKRRNERLLREQKEQEWKLKELESENKHVELQKQSAELEMQALRAQMNPHFIFNSLSSINHFIVKNESKTASSYLTRFSRLIRMVLMNSQRKLIPLEDELEMLRLYLDMERLRFKNAFDYSIATTNAVESAPIFIPPLLLQPFCENAIWHGLMNKEGQGHLNISISEENNVLNCIIIDDGVGRETAAILKSKSAEREKSMGLQITAKRLSLLSDENYTGAFFEIDDLLDESGNAAGTKVTLNICYKRAMEEIV